jgi:AAA+ superfamily predicted ATPase
MDAPEIVNNSITIERELKWLEAVMAARMQLYFKHDPAHNSIFDVSAPDLEQDQSMYARFVQHYTLRFGERLVLIMSLVPHVRPQLFDQFFIKNKVTERFYTEFGGLQGKMHNGFLPTGETACFVLAGDDLLTRLYTTELFSEDHVFNKHGVLKLHNSEQSEPYLSGSLQISKEFLTYLTTGEQYNPPFSASFPAKRIETSLTWSDLVLDDIAREEIDTILHWLKYQEEIKQGASSHLKKLMMGYRALFFGPPGTGKSLTASLLGESTGKKVYRVDLSQVVSKYIGETEKNLSALFDTAENKQWILFFDEADSLFGKRTEISDSKDKFANQETSFLLQRIEDYNGLIILATNLKPNIDMAFIRRFQSIIYFRSPNHEQRELLWKKVISRFSDLHEINVERIAADYEVAGGAINNIVQFAWLNARKNGERPISSQDIVQGIKREFQKEGKTFK